MLVDAIDRLPLTQQASNLSGLAVAMNARGDRSAAKIQALRAWRLAREIGDSKDIDKARVALSAISPGYHIQISTDAMRIAAWQAALTDLLRPGMLVLEVGAGSGILAMLAAQGGADVVSCEEDIVLASIAQEVVRHNGLAGRIRIIGKPVADLRVPEDLPRPADLLLLDVFGDTLFNFNPFKTVREASRLLRPGAITVPMHVSLLAALSDFRRWRRVVPGRVAGFDLGPLLDLASMQLNLDAADPDLLLRSTAEPMVSAALPDDLPAPNGVSERMLVSDGGPVNGVALWLRIELARGHVLEARPGVTPVGFYAKPQFFAFREPFDTMPGQACSIRLEWMGKQLSIGPSDGLR